MQLIGPSVKFIGQYLCCGGEHIPVHAIDVGTRCQEIQRFYLWEKEN